MMEGHISKAFDGDLAALHIHVLQMGGLALEQVREAAHAYTEWDTVSAERVMEREAMVNTCDQRIEAEQLSLIARRQPVAYDLRAVVCMVKAVADLERVGDEARKIARAVLAHAGRPGPATARDARHLGQFAVSLLRLALEAFDRLDASVAAEVIKRDKDLDAEYAAGLRRLLTRAMEDPRHFDVALQAAFVLKSLERIGDHARNLARQVLAIGEAANSTPQPAAGQEPVAPVAGAR